MEILPTLSQMQHGLTLSLFTLQSPIWKVIVKLASVHNIVIIMSWERSMHDKMTRKHRGTNMMQHLMERGMHYYGQWVLCSAAGEWQSGWVDMACVGAFDSFPFCFNVWVNILVPVVWLKDRMSEASLHAYTASMWVCDQPTGEYQCIRKAISAFSCL